MQTTIKNTRACVGFLSVTAEQVCSTRKCDVILTLFVLVVVARTCDVKGVAQVFPTRGEQGYKLGFGSASLHIHSLFVRTDSSS